LASSASSGRGDIEPPFSFDATIRYADGGYSSAAERLTVAQDVVGSIPTSRPNSCSIPENLNRLVPGCEFILEDANSAKPKDGQLDG
jgi:hypothetical protein